MLIKLLLFFVILPISAVVFSASSLIHSILSHLGYLLVVAILGWEITSRIVNGINKCGIWKVNPNKKIVVITGCDSGFGYSTAKKLNRYGFTVFATCLHPDGESAKRLKTEVKFPENLIIEGLNVTKDEEINNVHDKLSEYISNGYAVWGLVNNAGIAVAGEPEWGTFEHNFGDVFQVNCFGVIKVTRELLPLIRRCKGRVVIISSISGRFTHSNCIAYSMTKHAAISFADGLRLSLSKFGVKVICIEPGPYLTDIVKDVYTQLRRIWEETDVSIRNEYSENSYSKALKSLKFATNNAASSKLHEVPDAIFNSLVCPFPNFREVCGNFAVRSVVSLLSILPIDLSYHLIKRM